MTSPYREGADRAAAWRVYEPPRPERIMVLYVAVALSLAGAGVLAAWLVRGSLADLVVGLLAGASLTPWLTRLVLLVGPGAWRAAPRGLSLRDGAPMGGLLALPSSSGGASTLVSGHASPEGDGERLGPIGAEQTKVEVSLVVRTFRASPLVFPLSAAPLVLASLGWYVLALNLAIVYPLVLFPVIWITAQISRELSGYAMLRVGASELLLERGAEHMRIPRAAIHAVRWRGDGLELRWADRDAHGEPRERSVELYGVGPGALEPRLVYETLR